MLLGGIDFTVTTPGGTFTGSWSTVQRVRITTAYEVKEFDSTQYTWSGNGGGAWKVEYYY